MPNPIFLPISTATGGATPISLQGVTPPISDEANCGYIDPIPAAQIIGLTDPKQKNAQAAALRYYYTDETNDPAAAKSLYEAVNTPYTNSRLIPQYLAEGDLSSAQTLLANLPNNDDYADLKMLYNLYYSLYSHGKTLWDIDESEQALLRQLAATPNKVGFNARAALLMLYGEEYGITLPADEQGNNYQIGFKTNQSELATTLYSLYPNPAHDHLTITHHLPDWEQATLVLYGTDGRAYHRIPLVGEGTYQLNTSQLPNGIYIATLEQDGLAIQRQQIVIVK